MAAIFQTTFSKAFSWIKMHGFRLKFHKGPINNIQAMDQIMAWRRPGDKPSSEPMVVRLLTHICVTQPQWVESTRCFNQLGTEADGSGRKLGVQNLEHLCYPKQWSKTETSGYDLTLIAKTLISTSIRRESVGSMSNRRRSEGLCYLGWLWKQAGKATFITTRFGMLTESLRF